MIVLTSRYADAVAYAADVHAHQRRHGTDVPYVAHLLGVSSLVLEGGGDEDLAIAGLLHDAAEDHGGEARLADIASRFGPRVSSIVRACSDWLGADGEPKLDWEERKRTHLERLRSASDEVMVVWVADKVHNCRAMVTDVQSRGPEAMAVFHAAPDRIVWYYRENLAIAELRSLPSALIVPLRTAVRQLVELIDEAG